MDTKHLVGVIIVAVVVASVPVSGQPTPRRATDARPTTGDARPPSGRIAVDRLRGASVQRTCDYRRLFDAVDQSVVVVEPSNETGAIGEGSGWIYDRTGSTAYVVTNWHVAYNATDFDVQFDGGQWREAELVGASAWTDLAVLRVDDAPASASALELASDQPEPGRPVAALGSPFGLAESISEGVVSGVGRAPTVPYQDGGNRTIPDAIQTSAAVNPGNSGGPLVDCRGRVVGVNFAGVGVFSSGVNFAISARLVRRVVPSLRERGRFPTPLLGVRTVSVDPTLADTNNLSATRGVMVVDVPSGGPAAGALRGAPAVDRRTGAPYGGDVILGVDGTRIDDDADLLSYLYLETRPGETVNLTVLRDGQNRTVPVTLGERREIPVRPGRQPGRPTTTARPNNGTGQSTTTAA